MAEGRLYLARRAYLHLEDALEVMDKYVADPPGEDRHREIGYLRKDIAEALANLREHRQSLEGRDDAVPPPDLLDVIERGCAAGVHVVTAVSDDLYATSAVEYLDTARAYLGQARREA